LMPFFFAISIAFSILMGSITIYCSSVSSWPCHPDMVQICITLDDI
jgi:hypothetical protein